MIGTGILWALMFAGPAAALSAIRTRAGATAIAAAIANLVVDLIVLTLIDSLVFYFKLPPQQLWGLISLIFLNLVIVAIVASFVDGAASIDGDGSIGAATVAGWLAVLVFAIIWIVGYNSGHDAKKAISIVHVSVEASDALPASTTSNMVVVSPDIATSKANSAMSTGIANQRGTVRISAWATPTCST